MEHSFIAMSVDTVADFATVASTPSCCSEYYWDTKFTAENSPLMDALESCLLRNENDLLKLKFVMYFWSFYVLQD